MEELPTPTATPPATCFLQIVGSRLRIPQVTPADSGEYVCHVSNGAGSRETSLIVTIQGSGSSHGESREGRGSRQVAQRVAERSPVPSLLSHSGCVVHTPLSPVPSVSPPIRIESSSPTVVEGQTLDLNCVVARQPQAIITWYKRGGSLPSRHQVQSGATAAGVEPGSPGVSRAGSLSHGLGPG